MRILASAALLLAGSSAWADDLPLRIPPVQTSVSIEKQPVSITAAGTISRALPSTNRDALHLELTADLTDLQANITAILRAALDKSNRCGERLSIERATLELAAPSAVLTAYAHYERYACAKAFGKEIVKRLVAGNAAIPVKLTPAVEAGRAIKLVSETGEIQADGSLGEVLRSGTVGSTVRDKISAAVESALDHGAGLGAALPAGTDNLVTIETAQFAAAASGGLTLVLAGEIRISAEQVRDLMNRWKAR